MWAASFGVWASIAFAATATIEMYQIVNGRPRESVAGMEFSQLLTYAPLTPFAFGFALQYPIQRSNWVRRSLLHLAAGLVFTLGHVSLRALVPYGYWDPATQEWSFALWNSHLHAFRVPWIPLKSMFFSNVVDDITGTYLPIILIAHVISYYKSTQERELRATQLEGQLTKTRLQTLKNQLQPHFLFNTLHSISALMLTDVDGADRMMTSLSDMLRMSLEDNGNQLTALGREIEFLNVYLDIEKVRFGDRLHVAIDIAAECLDAQVPHLLLQPLVENAVRHGISKQSSPGEIQVVARSEGRQLKLWVRDNGPGLATPPQTNLKYGVGLRVTQERLSTLYGDEQSFEIRNGTEGGAEVYLRMPLQVATEKPSADLITYG